MYNRYARHNRTVTKTSHTPINATITSPCPPPLCPSLTQIEITAHPPTHNPSHPPTSNVYAKHRITCPTFTFDRRIESPKIINAGNVTHGHTTHKHASPTVASSPGSSAHAIRADNHNVSSENGTDCGRRQLL